MQTPESKENKVKTKRLISMSALYNMKFVMLTLTGAWFELIGNPEASGVWLIWGVSGNGKTRFCLMLAKYLTQFYNVVYLSLEEGARASFQKAAVETNMKEVARRFNLLEGLDLNDIRVLMRKRKSPRIWIIDSFQYLELTRKQYKELKEEFPDKLIIFISHAEGKEPAGKVAKFARYDADVKILVRGYKAFATSRFGGGQPFTISEDRAASFYGDDKPLNPTQA